MSNRLPQSDFFMLTMAHFSSVAEPSFIIKHMVSINSQRKQMITISQILKTQEFWSFILLFQA